MARFGMDARHLSIHTFKNLHLKRKKNVGGFRAGKPTVWGGVGLGGYLME